MDSGQCSVPSRGNSFLLRSTCITCFHQDNSFNSLQLATFFTHHLKSPMEKKPAEFGENPSAKASGLSLTRTADESAKKKIIQMLPASSSVDRTSETSRVHFFVCCFGQTNRSAGKKGLMAPLMGTPSAFLPECNLSGLIPPKCSFCHTPDTPTELRACNQTKSSIYEL